MSEKEESPSQAAASPQSFTAPTMSVPKKYSTPTRTKKNRKLGATGTTIDSELSGMMSSSLNVSSLKKKKKHVEKGFLSSGAPSLLYHWEDENNNNCLTLEVLLFGAIDESKLTFCLEDPHPITGNQILSFSNPLPPAWLSMQNFEKNSDMRDYNTIKQHSARRRILVDLEEKHLLSKTNQILSQQKFLLPYQVKNFNKQHPYEGTGYFLDKRPVVKQSRRGGRRGGNDSAKIVDIMNVLVIHMVSEEKCSKLKKKKARHTFYSKACTYEAASSDSSSDDDNDSANNHTARTSNNNFATSRSRMQRTTNNSRNQQQHSSQTAFTSSAASSGNFYRDDNLSVDNNMEISLGSQDVELSFETADGNQAGTP